MVVIIRVNDDNWGTKDAFIAQNVEAARNFICKDAECEMDELNDFKVEAMSTNCEVYDFDGLVYRIHLKPENV